MKLNFFKRQKVEKIDNAAELESLTVVLPSSKKEVTIGQLVNDADAGMAHPDHLVDLGEGFKMTVKDMCNEYAKMKEKLTSKKSDDDDDDKVEVEVEDKKKDDDDAEVEAEDVVEDDDDAENSDDAKVKAEKKDGLVIETEEESAEEHEAVEELAKKKKNAAEKAKRLKNAGPNRVALPEAKVIFNEDMVARGRELFGS